MVRSPARGSLAPGGVDAAVLGAGALDAVRVSGTYVSLTPGAVVVPLRGTEVASVLGLGVRGRVVLVP